MAHPDVAEKRLIDASGRKGERGKITPRNKSERSPVELSTPEKRRSKNGLFLMRAEKKSFCRGRRNQGEEEVVWKDQKNLYFSPEGEKRGTAVDRRGDTRSKMTGWRSAYTNEPWEVRPTAAN